ncbi:MAG: ATP-binding protein [Tindallia sp. MSAO_Bac2]|nr:MAG: ATP-binding protein [Tindallia sp. MSAO_Bac2]
MKELALHILDIVQNSITADAKRINLKIAESIKDDELTIVVEDDGFGMDEEMLMKVTDPFVTSRTTRKVGLGIPLLKQAAEECEGSLRIHSEVNSGTTIKATFQHSHIDRVPLGDIPETICTILLYGRDFDLLYEHLTDQGQFKFDTAEIRQVLQETPLTHPDVIVWIRESLTEELRSIAATTT